MKITYILETFQGGGKERRCLQLIQGLNKEGYKDIQVIILNNDIVDYPELFNTSANIIMVNRKLRGLSFIQTFKEVKEHIKVFAPDVIQPWGELSMFLTAIMRLTHKFVLLCANVADCNAPKKYSYRYLINSFAHYMADKVIGNSFAGLSSYRVPPQKAVCIYNGFNEDRYKLIANINKEKLREEIQISTHYTIAMFSRINEVRKDKDHESYIALAKNILSQRNDVTFLAVGKGRDEDINRLSNLLTEKEKENFKFLGFRNDVEALMSITDISVLFSNYKTTGEGLSNVILESMAFSLPVIATNGGGSPEIIKDGSNGFLIDKNDCNVATDCLNKLLDDPSLMKKMKFNAQKTVEKKFTLNKMVKEYITLYTELLKNSRTNND